MVVTKGLILKLIGGLGTAGLVVPGIYFREDLIDLIFNLQEEEILDRLGINCTETSCTLKNNKELSVIQEGEEKITISSAWETGNGKGKLLKLKKEKDGDAGSYRYGLKFLIEGGDISLNGGKKKMEEFETYEIGRESFSRNSRLFLSRRNKSNVEKEKKLGLPEGCNLPMDQNETTCSNLDRWDLHRMNFSWKNASAPEIAGKGTINMKIKKVISADEKTIFDNGYKFTLENNPKITFHKQEGGKEVVEANTNIEFTIFRLSNEINLKKAWTLEKLAKKAGFQSCASENDSCDFGDTINVFFDNANYTENASIKTADKSKKMTVAKAVGYNQGFKFTTSSDIELENGTPSAAGKKIEANASYEVKEKEIGGSWK